MKTFFNRSNNSKPSVNYYSVMDANKGFFYAIISSILASFAFSILIILACSIFGLTAKELSDGNQVVGYLQIIVMPLVYFLLFYFYSKRNNIKAWQAIGIKNKVNPLYLLVVIAMAFICLFGLVPFINLITKPFELMGYEGSDYPFVMNNWWTLLLGIIGYAMLPAFSEELVFRGIVQKGYEKRYTGFTAVFVSTLAFCLMHGSLQQTFYQLALGVLLGVIYLFGKNIIYPMAFHFINNACVLLVDYFKWPNYLSYDFFDYTTFWGVALPIIILLVTIGALVGLIFLLKHLNKKSVDNTELIVEGENIIIEENTNKFSFKNVFKTQNTYEKMYLLLGFGVALFIWISNTIEGF